jgi:Serine hydrolase (FSH1)/RWD domain
MSSDKKRSTKTTTTTSTNQRGNRDKGGKGARKRRTAECAAVVGRILVLHGNRQTGELLLSRMDKLRKKFRKERGYELVAIDAPHMHLEDPLLRTWWKTRETSEGLDDTLRVLCETWNGDSNGKHTERNSGSSIVNHRVGGSVEDNDNDPAPTPFCGVLGFSQGARLAHLMAVLHEHGKRRPTRRPNDNDDDANDRWFPGLKFVILAAGYDAPLPDVVQQLLVAPSSSATTDPANQPTLGKVTSLHVWGEADKLITPEQSRQLSLRYQNPAMRVHDGGHHVPMRAANVAAYLDFVGTLHGTGSAASSSVEASPLEASSVRPSGSVVDGVDKLSVSSSASQPASHKADRNVEASRLPTTKATTTTMTKDTTTTAEPNGILATTTEPPDADNLQAQLDELEAIQTIYPDEFRLTMKSLPTAAINEGTFNDFPIRYEVDLVRTDEDGDSAAWWPPRPVAVGVTYPPNYPLERGPIVRLVHANNVMELASAQAEQCLDEMRRAAQLEQGMCCVLSCIQAAREYFDSGRARRQVRTNRDDTSSTQSWDESDAPNEPTTAHVSKIKPSSRARIDECNLQGLDIAESILKSHNRHSADRQTPRGGKGGSWTYTIGLVGKPSVRFSLYLLAERTLITNAHPALSQRLSGGKVHVLQRGDGVRSAAR